MESLKKAKQTDLNKSNKHKRVSVATKLKESRKKSVIASKTLDVDVVDNDSVISEDIDYDALAEKTRKQQLKSWKEKRKSLSHKDMASTVPKIDEKPSENVVKARPPRKSFVLDFPDSDVGSEDERSRVRNIPSVPKTSTAAADICKNKQSKNINDTARDQSVSTDINDTAHDQSVSTDIANETKTKENDSVKCVTRQIDSENQNHSVNNSYKQKTLNRKDASQVAADSFIANNDDVRSAPVAVQDNDADTEDTDNEDNSPIVKKQKGKMKKKISKKKSKKGRGSILML